MGEHLPFELITEILLKVPAKDLLRCRCVSKRWCFLIDSACFIHQQLVHSIHSFSNQTLFIRHKSVLRNIDLDSLAQDFSAGAAVSLTEINYPLMCYSDEIKLLGSCNGLICLSNVADDVIIWNPSLRKHRFLPNFGVKARKRSERPLLSVCVYGFGFVHKSDDYKLLRLVQYISRPSESDVCVYSMSSNSWRQIHDMPYSLIYPRKMGVFVDMALHWIMTPELVPDSPNYIVGFNLESEDFSVIPQPDVVDQSFEIDVAVLDGCLCMVANYKQTGVDVWVMNNYGKKDSWSKLFSILQSDAPRFNGFMWPLTYCQASSRILVQQDKNILFWYDVKRKLVQKIQIQNMPSSFETQVCLSSLVPLDYMENSKKQGSRDKEDLDKRDDFLSVGFKLIL
ncbi:hypothetical protein SAY86_016820 [Trapa natans]|uniref:F-box domain-containing protein n=1 Tax=Trapa natans TaxID=22666 RepID=A0AAN7M488_TRANT|nr:hypothetical protein SAY86_016820 [Trapa natans]